MPDPLEHARDFLFHALTLISPPPLVELEMVLRFAKHPAMLVGRGCAVNNECLGFLGRKEGKHAITLEKGLKAAAVLGCAFRGPQAISDQSGADVQIGLNTSH